MSQSSRFRHAFIAAVALLLLPVARAETLPEADTREVRAYTLTEIALGKYVEATRKLSAIPLDCDVDDPDIGSLTEAAARIDAVPAPTLPCGRRASPAASTSCSRSRSSRMRSRRMRSSSPAGSCRPACRCRT